MFYEEGSLYSGAEFNETVVITKYVQPSVTRTVFYPSPTTLTLTSIATTTTTATARSSPSTVLPNLTLDIPHHPQVDTAFTAAFGTLCLVLVGGVVLRRKSKKLKAFNIPVILGTFCLAPFLFNTYPKSMLLDTSSMQTTTFSAESTN